VKFFLIILILLNFLTTAPKANEVNVFSSRHYSSDIQLYEKFTSISGIKVNVVSGNDAALQKELLRKDLTQKQIFILLQTLED
jgi:iron(III) transport system substrate-binding protein